MKRGEVLFWELSEDSDLLLKLPSYSFVYYDELIDFFSGVGEDGEYLFWRECALGCSIIQGTGPDSNPGPTRHATTLPQHRALVVFIYPISCSPPSPPLPPPHEKGLSCQFLRSAILGRAVHYGFRVLVVSRKVSHMCGYMYCSIMYTTHGHD